MRFAPEHGQVQEPSVEEMQAPGAPVSVFAELATPEVGQMMDAVTTEPVFMMPRWQVEQIGGSGMGMDGLHHWEMVPGHFERDEGAGEGGWVFVPEM